jgi:drug/metabolite transporter (DMT)-like permease
MTAFSFVLATFSVSLNALAQIVLRKAMLTLGVLPPMSEPIAFALIFFRNIYLWGGFACYAVSIVLWLGVLSSNQVSVAYPMIAVGYVIVTALSFLILGETIPPARLLGIAMICVGVLLVVRAA